MPFRNEHYCSCGLVFAFKKCSNFCVYFCLNLLKQNGMYTCEFDNFIFYRKFFRSLLKLNFHC